MANIYLSVWNEWEPVWTFWYHKSISGKLIRGHIIQRKHRLALSSNGDSWMQYATKKEVFLEALKNG